METPRLGQSFDDILAALVLAVQSLENRMANVEARLAAVERATPWKAPKKSGPPR